MIGEAIETLPVGHYAIGLLDDGDEIDIYRAGADRVINVATGLAVAVLRWRKR